MQSLPSLLLGSRRNADIVPRHGRKFVGAAAGVPYGTPANWPMRSGAVRLSNRLMNDALDRNSGGFTAADAERGDTALQALRFEGMQQGHDEARACGANGDHHQQGLRLRHESNHARA
jgi:hypothetical protein